MSGAAIFAGLGEACILASAACVAVGWRHIRQRRVAQHRRMMLTGTWLGIAFFLLYVAHTLLYGDTSFGGPAAWQIPYLTFLQAHVILATVAGVLGVITVRRALAGRFAAHRAVAPWTATLWLIAAGSGLVVFLLLYIVFPPGPSLGMVHTLLGHGAAR